MVPSDSMIWKTITVRNPWASMPTQSSHKFSAKQRCRLRRIRRRLSVNVSSIIYTTASVFTSVNQGKE